MRPSSLRPIAQVFVCTHARRPDDPLRSGCGASGPALFTALKKAVTEGGVAGRVWITATGCQGHCPRTGCSVTLHPKNEHLIEAAEPDAREILRAALTPRTTS